MSAYDDNDPRALDRLEDLLDAFATARLTPRGPVLPRIRAHVLAQATAAAAAASPVARLRIVEPPKSARWSASTSLVRSAAALGFAAVLVAGTTAAVIAAPPGSPFYNARVYIEAMALPAEADARLAGHEHLLEERLAEAEAAASRGDVVGLAAALAAFQEEVDAATADVGDDATRLAHLEEMLAKHTAVLTALAARLPEESSIDYAIDTSSKAIGKLRARSEPAHPTHAPAGPRGGGGDGGDGQGGEGQGESQAENQGQQ